MAASAVPDERSGSMKRSRFSEEQIVYAIRQAESGTPVGDLCRQLGVSDATFYAWEKRRMRTWASANCVGCGRWKRRTAD
jgi:transposase-like protein